MIANPRPSRKQGPPNAANALPPLLRRKKQWFVVWGLLGLMVLAWIWWHRDARISGQIRDLQGQGAITDVELQLDAEPPLKLPQLQEQFVLNRVKPGRHTLSIRAAGYLPQQHQVMAKAGEHVRLKIGLVAKTPEKRVQGSILLMGTQAPHALQVYNAERQHLLEIKLASKPLAAVLSGEQLFVLVNGKDEIQRYEIQTGQALPAIALPSLSGPQRLLMTPNGKWLLVLNVVARNLTVIERASQQVYSVIPLPLAATDLALLPDGATAVVAGEEGVVRVFFLTQYVDKPIKVVFRPESRPVLLPQSGKLLVPNREWVSEVDLASGKFEEWELPFAVKQMAVIDDSQLLLAGDQLGAYNLYQKQLEGEAVALPEGSLQAMLPFQGQVVCVTRDPARWYPCWPQAGQQPDTQPLRGQPEFILSAQIP